MKKLYRSRNNRIFGGVCGGLGYYSDIDPTLIRFLFIFIGLMTAVLPLLFIYVVAVLIIPENPKMYAQKNFRILYRSVRDRKIAGICGGISEFFKVDATIIRLVTAFLAFITAVFPIAIMYIIGIFIIPENPHDENTIEIEVE